MSFARGIGMLVDLMALLAWRMSIVTQTVPSSLGASTGFETHGAGPWCSSIRPWSSMSVSAFLNFPWWYGIGLRGSPTGVTVSSIWNFTLWSCSLPTP